jgi:hypothetical protein
MAAAVLLAGVGFSGAAEAACWWTGHGWSCPPPGYASQGRRHAYRSYGGYDDPAFGYYRGRMTGPYAAFGAASHMGPDPGGGFYHMGRTQVGTVD